jgi:phosphoglycolate phosphatase-like HAD superfamily hydrolase
MIIANTGQETVRMIVDELQRLRSEQTFERLVIQILLRAPSLTDERRAENAEQTIANAQRLDSRSASANAIVIEHRFYAGPVPLRCLLVEYASGKQAGFLSYYDWHQRVQRRATSTRDAASKRARIVYETDSHPALDSYLSWFSHFWGAHKLRAIVFDFDDTLFSTTEPQTSAWLLALRSSLEKELLQVSDLAPKLQAVWDRDHEARNFVRDSFFSQQSEDAIFAAIVPDEAKRRRVFEFVRKERHKYRRMETMRDAQLVPNIAPSELARLSAEYVLVIVSATDEQLIDDVLKRWKLKEYFPYVVGREAPRQDWLDIETKSQNLLRVTHILGIPLERMVFIGDSHADYRSARQLGIRFIENRYNADIYRRASLIRDSNPVLQGILSRESTEGELTRLLEAIEASLS